MTDEQVVEKAEADENVINIFDEVNEAPLNQSEEDRLKEVKEEKTIKKVTELYERVMSIKAAIEEDNFIEIFIKPIKGNITRIKVELETVEKPRELAVLQGSLNAYRKMLNFPETACEALETEIESIKRELPLFYGDNDLIKKCYSIRFDRQLYKIIS